MVGIETKILFRCVCKPLSYMISSILYKQQALSLRPSTRMTIDFSTSTSHLNTTELNKYHLSRIDANTSRPMPLYPNHPLQYQPSFCQVRRQRLFLSAPPPPPAPSSGLKNILSCEPFLPQRHPSQREVRRLPISSSPTPTLFMPSSPCIPTPSRFMHRECRGPYRTQALSNR